jgi:predicted nucleic acid-binding protein
MSEVLLDTDVLIDHLRGRRSLKIGRMAISVVTRTELYAGERREAPAVEVVLAQIEELEINATIARRAGRIQRDTGLKIADALIAATALEKQLPLMTRNRRHFERVPDLTVRAPQDQPESAPSGDSP